MRLHPESGRPVSTQAQRLPSPNGPAATLKAVMALVRNNRYTLQLWTGYVASTGRPREAGPGATGRPRGPDTRTPGNVSVCPRLRASRHDAYKA